MRAALLLGLAQAQLREGNLPKAEQTVKELRLSPFASSWQAHLKDIENQLIQARTGESSGRGPFASLERNLRGPGQAGARRGAAGIGTFRTAFGPPRHTLYIEDSKSDPAEAAEAVTRLVRERRGHSHHRTHGRRHLLERRPPGPAVGRALDHPDPGGRDHPGGENTFFRTFSLPASKWPRFWTRRQINSPFQTLLCWPLARPTGRGFTKLIAQGVASRGGRLVETVYYDSKLTDFTKEVKKLVHLPSGNYRPGRPDSPQPVINFQALYIPDGPERVGMLAPQLAYYDITGVTLLGTSLWLRPQAGGGRRSLSGGLRISGRL